MITDTRSSQRLTQKIPVLPGEEESGSITTGMIMARCVVKPSIDDAARWERQMVADVGEGLWVQPNTCASHTPEHPRVTRP